MSSTGFARKFKIGPVWVSRTTYADATASIVAAAHEGRRALVAATSAHGLTLAEHDPAFADMLNRFELVTPDGMPVRWALNLLHGAGLADRVYGPNLTLSVCQAAAEAGVPIYLYGSKPEVLDQLVIRLPEKAPGLRIAGYKSPPFRPLTAEEDAADVAEIVASGAKMVFVGLGCPRQERWAFEHRERLPMPILCVGAAFDFHAGTLRQAPAWMQRAGLEWLFRLAIEPRRLWRRYARHVPAMAWLITREYARNFLSTSRQRQVTEPGAPSR
jgi:N-acetylglucosaminyldiphosphoundecaprenol N-acetyl-beta-D-mannosaminyltransferase